MPKFSMTSRRLISRRTFGFLVLMLFAFARPRTASAHEVLVCSYFTPEGVKVSSPTSDHPLFYSLESTPVRNWTEPEFFSLESARRLFTSALGVNRYLPVETMQSPDLIIVYHWGVATPLFYDEGTPAELFFNRTEMLALLCGRSLDVLPEHDRTAVKIAAREERFFVLISAYRADDWLNQKKRTLLWRTHMSVPTGRLSMKNATSILLAAGSSMLGRDSLGLRPVQIDVKGVLQRDPDDRL